MDGHPDDTLSTGQIFRYQFRVNNRAGTYWYYPHPIHHMASQVYKGLAGMILIRDTTEQKLHLPKKEREIPLIIQDKRSNWSFPRLYCQSPRNHMGNVGRLHVCKWCS